ncbi:hypothetical protein Hanom_Chr01g00051171 [Helianthus anomalus]
MFPNEFPCYHSGRRGEWFCLYLFFEVIHGHYDKFHPTWCIWKWSHHVDCPFLKGSCGGDRNQVVLGTEGLGSMSLTIEALAQDFDRIRVHAGPEIPNIHNFGHYHAWSRVYATYSLMYLSDKVCSILGIDAA